MRRIGMFVVLAVLAVFWWQSSGIGDAGPGGPSAPISAPSTSAAPAERALPVEARETIALIDAGGPFPYDRDGAVFENRERRLPAHDRGYWREYTVDTPGSDDRGARRLVEGEAGDLYYTDDHYGSFRRIRGPS